MIGTQEGMVGKLLEGLVRGTRLLETGVWSEVVDIFVRGSHIVLVCG